MHLKHILPFIVFVRHMMNSENHLLEGEAYFFAKRKVSYNWINDLEKDLVDVYRAFADSKGWF